MSHHVREKVMPERRQKSQRKENQITSINWKNVMESST